MSTRNLGPAPYSGPLPGMPAELLKLPSIKKVVIAGTGRCGTTFLNRMLWMMGFGASRNEYPFLSHGFARWDDFDGPVIKSPHATTFFVAHPEAMQAVSAFILPIRDLPEKVVHNHAGKWPPLRAGQLGMPDDDWDPVHFQDYAIGAFMRHAVTQGVHVYTLPFPRFLEQKALTGLICAAAIGDLVDTFCGETWSTLWDAYHEEREH